MADSEFSSVHWESPPPTAIADVSESPNNMNNGLGAVSPPAQNVPPDMDPLRAPPTNEHTLICVCLCSSFAKVDGIFSSKGGGWDERCLRFLPGCH